MLLFGVGEVASDTFPLQIKGKVVPVNTVKAYRQRGGMDSPFQNLGARWR